MTKSERLFFLMLGLTAVFLMYQTFSSSPEDFPKAYKSKTVDDCITMPYKTDIIERDYCVQYFAVRDQNADNCLKIAPVSQRFYCFEIVAEALKDPSICQRIKLLDKDNSSADPEDAQIFKDRCLKNLQPR